MQVTIENFDMSSADDPEADTVALDMPVKTQLLVLPIVDVSRPPKLREVVPGTLLLNPVELTDQDLIVMGMYCAGIPTWLHRTTRESYVCVIHRYKYATGIRWATFFKEVRGETA